ncbi:MAG: DUF3604 domain-containing protein [Candidatus Binatia bacterium]
MASSGIHIRVITIIVVLAASAGLLTCPTLASAQAGPPPWERTETRTDCGDFDAVRAPFFGETHIHTAYSADAIINGTTNDPRDAYEFAQGGALPLTPANPKATHQLRRSLDFAIVTDHAEFLGETSICSTPGHPQYDAPQCVEMRSEIGLPFEAPLDSNSFLTFFIPTASPALPRFDFCGVDGADCLAETSLVWQDIGNAAEEHYDRTASCSFTTFVGYEWTGNTSFNNIHRNVIFRNENVPDLPTTYFEQPTAEGLWNALTSECLDGLEGCDVLAIPHNSNISGGQMFLLTNDLGDPIGTSDARLRAELEPLVEIFQHKGESECHPMFSSTDELCGFEKSDQGSQLPGSPALALNYTRNVLMEGLEQEETLGVNPFKFGVIGSTDGHLATSGATIEDDYPGHVGSFDDTPTQRLLDFSLFHSGANPGGLAVFWAEENSRDALFSAMRRREAYATSGTRPVVRFFAGKFKKDLCESPTLALDGYKNGVPMGGEFGPINKGDSPTFVVSAQRDPGPAGFPGTQLQRVQIIKGWVDGTGTAQEKVFEVAGEPDNGATVDESTCIKSGVGADSLCASWQDPDFDPDQRAFYYARVVENPTCRYNAYDCNAAAVDCSMPGSIPAGYELCCDPAVIKTIQERAWTSAIWYRPESFSKFKAKVTVKGGGKDGYKLVAAFDSIPPELDPTSSDISLTVSDDDVIYSATIPAGTMEVKKPGASYVLSDKAGTTDGIKKATLKINSKGGGKITLKTIKLDLSNADLTDHFVHTTLRAGDFSLEHIRMWEAKGKALKPRS